MAWLANVNQSPLSRQAKIQGLCVFQGREKDVWTGLHSGRGYRDLINKVTAVNQEKNHCTEECVPYYNMLFGVLVKKNAKYA